MKADRDWLDGLPLTVAALHDERLWSSVGRGLTVRKDDSGALVRPGCLEQDMTELEGRSTPGIEFVEGRMRLSERMDAGACRPSSSRFASSWHRHTGRLRHGPGDTRSTISAPNCCGVPGADASDDAVIPPSLRAVFQRLAEIRLEPPPRPAARAC